MAADEALLESVGRGDSAPTFRLYQWSEPTISLGYFQKFADYESLEPPAGELPVVRRLTGGGAILHDLELTYSLTLPSNHAMLEKGPNRLYEFAHDAVISAFESLSLATWRGCASDDSGPARGPFFCFARRHCFDVLVGPEEDAAKIAGSAQRRTRHAVLQHGSIILASRYIQQPSAALGEDSQEAADRFGKRFVKAFAEYATSTIVFGEWRPQELLERDGLIAKYKGAEWTRHC